MTGKPPSPTRRDFLAATAAAGLAGALAGCATPNASAPPAEAAAEPAPAAEAPRPAKPVPARRVLGANGLIQCGVIGVGNRGSTLLREILERDDVEVKAVTDTYDVWRERAVQWCRDKGQHPKDHVRFEEMIENNRLDAVVIATPDHIHAPATLAALDAGLDVYCEKPITLTESDAAEVRDRVRETGAVFQAGTQLRSQPVYQKARELVQSGAIGQVALVLVNRHYKADPNNSLWPSEANPANVHWNEFARGTPPRPLDLRRYFHWRDFVEYSNGLTGDVMVHHLDACHFITGAAVPAHVVSSGGIYVLKDGRTCPDTVSTLVEYPEAFQFNFSATAANGQYGLVERYLGTEGALEIRDMAEMVVYRKGFEETVDSQGLDDAPHLANFFECMRSRGEPIAPVEAGFAAAAIAHRAVQSERSARG